MRVKLESLYDQRWSGVEVVMDKVHQLLVGDVRRLVRGHQAAYQAVGGSAATSEENSPSLPGLHDIICGKVALQALNVRDPPLHVAVKLTDSSVDGHGPQPVCLHRQCCICLPRTADLRALHWSHATRFNNH